MSPRRLLILTACAMLAGCAALAWFAVIHPAGRPPAARPVPATPLAEAAPGGSSPPAPPAPSTPGSTVETAIPALPAPSSAASLPVPLPAAPAGHPSPPVEAQQVRDAPAPAHPPLWTGPHHYRGGRLRPVRFRHRPSFAPRTAPAVARARLAAARQVCDRTATIGVLSPWTAICHWMLPR